MHVVVAEGSLHFGDELEPSTPVPGYTGLAVEDQPSHPISIRGTVALAAFFLRILGLLVDLDSMWLANLWPFGR